MTETNDAAVWEVVAARPYDKGDTAQGAEEISLATGPEDEARRIYHDTAGQAADQGYEYVSLRRDGVEVESWPQATGWTV
ncbi:hypothetical protein E4P42_14395 [Mycobacterium sp. PS03-16]|uniref:hypothetical protein n=1 Tax=Mycobacterium sp. PS03-16 TaxID=2559611 RepID=UPI001073A07D|nr:hypothetical protein [Mycobacterium sp. PS03-16]TFV57594.1 hypothetical protein E4P42_14395 [Mycobacterium sp. PS03-16]